jgi:glycosyltransferase involved in cell wall biosynthesis
MNEATEQVSVVIPLYNKERHIARAIQSALDQTYSNFELIVVNDGSTDQSAEVVRNISHPRIRMVRREHINGGGGHAARNLGITESRADLIAFLDADDEWRPGHLETIMYLSRKHPECGAYATTTAVMDESGRLVASVHDGIPTHPWEGVIPNYFRSATSYPVSASAVAIPRRVFDSVGLFPVGVAIGGDLDMWCRIALRYPICFSTQVGAIYHKEAENRICVSNTVMKQHSFVRAIQDALSSGILPPELRRDVFEYMAVYQVDIASRNILAGNPRYARQLLWSCRGTRELANAWKVWMLLSVLPRSWPARLRAAKMRLKSPLHAGSASKRVSKLKEESRVDE